MRRTHCPASTAMTRGRFAAASGGVRIAAVATALCLASHAPAAAAADDLAQARLGDDVFAAGGALTVGEPVAGDLFVAGGSVALDAAVAGDASAGAGKLRVAADVGDSLHAAAGQITINGKVGRHARLAGGQVELGYGSVVLGNVAVAGGQLRLLGAVHGDVLAAGGRLQIDGVVGGNVVAGSGLVELGPHARISGQLRHLGGSVQRDPEAQVAGGIEAWPSGGRHDDMSPAASRHAHENRAAIGWPWTLALVVLAAVLLAVLPGVQARVGLTLRQRPALSVALGLAWMVCAPVALLLLLLTVIGIPLTLLGGMLYVLLVPLAYVSAAIALGDWALRACSPAAASQWAWRVVAAAAVLGLLSQSARVPWLGAVLMSLTLLAGLGALALQLRPRRQAC